MTDFIQGFFIAIIICAALIIGRAMWNNNECERTHNVHRCEKIEQWVPAAWTPEETQ